MKFSIITIFTLLCTSLFAQISEGGLPLTKELAVKQGIYLTEISNIHNITAPDLEKAVSEDIENDYNGQKFRVGINIDLNLDLNDGQWEITGNQEVWRLKIKSKDALALGLYFSEEVEIFENGKLFLYNENNKQIIGAYTKNTPNFEAIEMIQGDVLTLEYSAPIGNKKPKISIKQLVYFYRGVEDHVSDYIDYPENYMETRAASCQVDVACTPESNGWSDQIRSVVHYTFSDGTGTFVCSASTINNTAEDCRPLILSAWHCGEPVVGSNMNSNVWYWNYQKSTCSPNSNGSNPSKGSQTMTGGTILASSGNGTLNNPPSSSFQVAGSDFYLLELNQNIPETYDPYFAGWDRSSTAANSGVSIHHPAGSAKKISTFSSNLTSTSFNNGGFNHFWGVNWVSTANGHGVTEGGSSGSPIFNQNGRIVGQLTGGSSSCNATSNTDVYGKMSSNWTANGTSNNARLAPYLDPINSNVNILNGTNAPCGSTPPPPGDCIDPNNSPYSMGFETNENLNDWSVFNVNNDLVNGSAVTWGVINESAFQSGAMSARTGDRLAYYLYNSQNPSIGANDWLVTPCIELEPGFIYTLSFWYRAAEAGGTVFPEKMKVNIGNDVNPSALTFNLTDLNNINNTNYQQETVSFTVQSSGEYFIGFHAYSDPDQYILGLDDILLSSVEESGANTNEILENSTKVFPNPTSDKVKIQFNNTLNIIESIELKNTMGQRLQFHSFNSSMNEIELDLNEYSNGIYFITIKTDKGTTTKKVIKD